jgi:hypothetical protein
MSMRYLGGTKPEASTPYCFQYSLRGAFWTFRSPNIGPPLSITKLCSLVDTGVAFCAKSDQILFRVVAGVTLC